MKKNNVKIGFIGMGPRGRHIVETLKIIPGYSIAALCDKNENLAGIGYDELGNSDVAVYTDYRKMLRESSIEAVGIAVEPENNAGIICDVLEAGKHVFCEVPLAYSIEDCWRIVSAVEKSGLKFMMNEQLMYSAFSCEWKKLVEQGRIGKVLFAEGEYFHGMGENRYWVDADTGERLSLTQAENNPKAIKSRLWAMEHPILYLPTGLSPLLSVLDDRVSKVSCMATRKQSYYHEWYPQSDIEVAIMHTEKDTIIRMVAGFVVPTFEKKTTFSSWYHVTGTHGMLETNRSNSDKMKMWFANSNMDNPADVMWEHTSAPAEARMSRHNGLDYYPLADFLTSILQDKEPGLNVYRAADIAAAAIVAAESAKQGGQLLEVPKFKHIVKA